MNWPTPPLSISLTSPCSPPTISARAPGSSSPPPPSPSPPPCGSNSAPRPPDCHLHRPRHPRALLPLRLRRRHPPHHHRPPRLHALSRHRPSSHRRHPVDSPHPIQRHRRRHLLSRLDFLHAQNRDSHTPRDPILPRPHRPALSSFHFPLPTHPRSHFTHSQRP